MEDAVLRHSVDCTSERRMSTESLTDKFVNKNGEWMGGIESVAAVTVLRTTRRLFFAETLTLRSLSRDFSVALSHLRIRFFSLQRL